MDIPCSGNSYRKESFPIFFFHQIYYYLHLPFTDISLYYLLLPIPVCIVSSQHLSHLFTYVSFSCVCCTLPLHFAWEIHTASWYILVISWHLIWFLFICYFFSPVAFLVCIVYFSFRDRTKKARFFFDAKYKKIRRKMPLNIWISFLFSFEMAVILT